MTAKPFGPTQTIDHLTCPTLRRFNRTWEASEEWQPHRMVGSAIHAGLAVLFKYPDAHVTALGAAIGVLDQEYQEHERWTMEALVTLISKALTKCDKTIKSILEVDTGVVTPDLGQQRTQQRTKHKELRRRKLAETKEWFLASPDGPNSTGNSPCDGRDIRPFVGGLFSFQSVCDYLDLDADYLRKGLRKWL